MTRVDSTALAGGSKIAGNKPDRATNSHKPRATTIGAKDKSIFLIL
jgi:hypothetical protein